MWGGSGKLCADERVRSWPNEATRKRNRKNNGKNEKV